MNALVLFFVVFFVQMQSMQFVSYGLLAIYLVVKFSKRLITRKKFRTIGLLYMFIWGIVTLFMVRSEYILLIQAKVELFWLTLGVVSAGIISVSYDADREKLIKTVILAGVLGAVINLISYFTGIFNDLFIAAPYAGVRAMGGFDSPNELGSFHVMILALAFGLLAEKKITKMNFLFVLSVNTILIYLTYSRGALLGVAGLLAISIFLLFLKSRHKIIFMSAIFALSFIAYKVAASFLLSDFSTIREKSSERGYLFDEVWRLFSESPIIGTGLGSFSQLTRVHNEATHSDFFSFMVSGGMIGLVFIVVFLSALIYKSYKDRVYPELIALLVFVSQALAFNHLIRGRVSFLFWVTVIILYSSKKVVKQSKSLENQLR